MELGLILKMVILKTLGYFYQHIVTYSLILVSPRMILPTRNDESPFFAYNQRKKLEFSLAKSIFLAN